MFDNTEYIFHIFSVRATSLLCLLGLGLGLGSIFIYRLCSRILCPTTIPRHITPSPRKRRHSLQKKQQNSAGFESCDSGGGGALKTGCGTYRNDYPSPEVNVYTHHSLFIIQSHWESLWHSIPSQCYSNAECLKYIHDTLNLIMILSLQFYFILPSLSISMYIVSEILYVTISKCAIVSFWNWFV